MAGKVSQNHEVTISGKTHDKVQSWLIKPLITIRKQSQVKFMISSVMVGKATNNNKVTISAITHGKLQSCLVKPPITIR